MTFVTTFKTWNNAILVAELMPTRITRVTASICEMLIAEIFAADQLREKGSLFSWMEKTHKEGKMKAPRMIARALNMKWSDILVLLGLKAPRWTRETAIIAGIAEKELCGKIPTKRRMNEGSKERRTPCADTCKKLFGGSFNNFLLAIGCKPARVLFNKKTFALTVANMARNLKRDLVVLDLVKEHNKTGTIPSYFAIHSNIGSIKKVNRLAHRAA